MPERAAMTENLRILADDSLKATLALWLPPVVTLIFVGIAIAITVAINRRTGRPKASSVFIFIGVMLGIGALRYPSHVERYEDMSWLGFFIQLLVAIAFIVIGYRGTELRKQIKLGRANNDANGSNEGSAAAGDVDE